MLKTYYVAVMPHITNEEIFSLGLDLLNFYENLWEAQLERLTIKGSEIREISIIPLKEKATEQDIH